MILTVLIDDEQHHAETPEDTELLISRVMKELDFGKNAWFTLDRQQRASLAYADSTLMVSINKSTGYGGLSWHVSTSYPKQGGIYEFAWVSDNPAPPTVDPKVLSDPHTPVFMAPASVLPLPDVRQVLDEFCHSRTGDRPSCINWVKGRVSGERAETASPADPNSEASHRAQVVLDDLMQRLEAGDIPLG